MRVSRDLVTVTLFAVVVFAASIAAATWLPVTEFFKGLASIPAVGALSSVLVQLWRDQLAHQRALELAQRQQDFALATASHMSNVVYDKHVAFCEDYVARTNEAIGQLFREGPGEYAYGIAAELSHIRVQHRTWLTEDIEARLIPFESAIAEIGAKHALLQHLEVGEQRTAIVQSIFKAFGLVSGIESPSTVQEQAIVAAQVVDALRDVLGIKELTALRQEAARVALRRIEAAQGDS